MNTRQEFLLFFFHIFVAETSSEHLVHWKYLLWFLLLMDVETCQKCVWRHLGNIWSSENTHLNFYFWQMWKHFRSVLEGFYELFDKFQFWYAVEEQDLCVRNGVFSLRPVSQARKTNESAIKKLIILKQLQLAFDIYCSLWFAGEIYTFIVFFSIYTVSTWY